MRLSAAVSKANTIEVEFDNEETLKVEYRPASYTPAQLSKMRAESEAAAENDEDAALSRMVDTMLQLLVSWDLTEDDGTEIPLTREALQHVPLNLFNEVISAVGEDQQAGKARRKR